MSQRKEISIVHLVDAPEAAPVLARWFVAEWTPWYGPGGDGHAEADLAECSSRDTLPLCLVALDGDGAVLGTAALKAESVGSESAPGPWLAAILVGEAHRGRGIATALTAAIEDEARRLGIDDIYTATDAAAGIMARRGWQPEGMTGTLRGAVTIFRRQLSDT